jgi:hypothetical protein
VFYSNGQAYLYTTYSEKIKLINKLPFENNIRSLPGVINLLLYEQPPLDWKFLVLANIYNKPYLLHLDGFQGLLTVYYKNSIEYKFEIETGAYNLRVSDNLIILQNYGLQESTIIDWLCEPKRFKISHRGTFEINPTFLSVSYEHCLDLDNKTFLKLKIKPFE